ncbi:hypothetical protein AN1V17_39500 [Vallitalea sediminicola]
MKVKNWGRLVILAIYGIIIIIKWNICIWVILLFATLICIMFINHIAYKIEDNKFFMATFVRRTLYFIPYIIAYIIRNKYYTNVDEISKFQKGNILIYSLLGIIVALLFLAIRLNDFRVLFNKDIISMSPLKTKKTLLNIYSNIGSAVTEELFYKGVVFFVLYNYGFGFIISGIVTSLSFMSIHNTQRYSSNFYTFKDYSVQFLISFIGCMLYLLSGYIAVPMIVHITYNLPMVVNDIMKCRVLAVKK